MAPTTATVAVLFTDVVGSTALVQRLGEVGGREALHAHREVLTAAVEAEDGAVVKWLGDGLMATFASTAAAVRAATAAQRTLPTAAPQAAEARMGIALGEATREHDGDWTGTPVILASRLCAAANTGEVLTADLVAQVLAGHDGFEFEALDPIALKGLGDVAAHRVRATGNDVAISQGPSPFVGRAEAVGRLQAAVEGGGGVVLVCGEPGIGKTRLVRHVTDVCVTTRVVWGRCDESPGAPSLWPWAQIVDTLVTAESLAADPERRSVLADAFPMVGPTLAGPIRPPEVEPDAARFRVFDAVHALLAEAAGIEPLALVFDDLHWADTASLLLLEFLAPRVATAGVTLVGTYRDVEVHRGHHLATTLGALARVEEVARVQLGGLSPAEVAALGRAVAGSIDQADLLTVVERSDGNPFFALELTRALQTGGARVPEGVRDAVGRTLDRLGSGAFEVLALAAVAGVETDVSLLTAAAGDDTAAVLGTLERGLAVGLLAESDVAPGRVRFAHALARDAVLTDLSQMRRLTLHGQLAEALDRRGGPLPQLAHHLLEAAPIGDVGRAVSLALDAADAAMASYGYEEALAWHGRVEEALEATGEHEPGLRLRMQLGRGRAMTAAGRPTEATEVFAAAMELADEQDELESLTEAALGWAGEPENSSAVDDENQPRANQLAHVEARWSTESPLRARLQARLGVAMADVADPAAEGTLASAEAMARRAADADALAFALRSYLRVTFRPDAIERRLAAADELIALGERTRRLDISTWGRRWRLIVLLELGEVDEVDRLLDQLEDAAAMLHQPFHEWGWVVRRAGRAMMNGDLATAGALMTRAFALASQQASSFTLAATANLLMATAFWKGELGNLRELLRERMVTSPALAAPLAWACAEGGDLDEAAALLRQPAGHVVSLAVGVTNQLLYPTLRAEAAALVGDADLAAPLYEDLLPYAAQLACITPGLTALTAVGGVLGRLALVLGEEAAAEEHLRVALAFEQRIGATALALRTQVSLAAVRHARGDVAEAKSLAADAHERGSALGLGVIVKGAAAVLQVDPGPPSTS